MPFKKSSELTKFPYRTSGISLKSIEYFLSVLEVEKTSTEDQMRLLAEQPGPPDPRFASMETLQEYYEQVLRLIEHNRRLTAPFHPRSKAGRR